MPAGRLRNQVAAIAIVALLWVCSAPVIEAGTNASWGGRVYQSDRITPRAGVVVSLVDEQAARTVEAQPTREDGAFALDDAPPGTYALQVATPEGVFLSTDPVTLEPGANAPMALALQASPFNASQERGLGNEASRKHEYIYAGLVALFGLFVIYQIVDDDDESPATIF